MELGYDCIGIIEFILASLPSFANAVVFNILGVQQFGGVLYQRCRYTPEPSRDPKTGLSTSP
jgi:hypothetical protein